MECKAVHSACSLFHLHWCFLFLPWILISLSNAVVLIFLENSIFHVYFLSFSIKQVVFCKEKKPSISVAIAPISFSTFCIYLFFFLDQLKFCFNLSSSVNPFLDLFLSSSVSKPPSGLFVSVCISDSRLWRREAHLTHPDSAVFHSHGIQFILWDWLKSEFMTIFLQTWLKKQGFY